MLSSCLKKIEALKSLVLHAKFQYHSHRTSGSGDDFKRFYHIWARLSTSALKPLDRLRPNFVLRFPWEVERKFIYISGPGHMAKMTAMPIYGPQKLSTELIVI